MANGRDADGLAAIGQLVENSIGAHPQRMKATELPPQGIAGERVPLEQRKSLLDRVDQRPVQRKQVATSSPGEDESCQRSDGRRPAIGKLAAKLVKRDRFAALELSKTHLQRREGIRIGEDFGGLLQRLVLVYRNQNRRGSPVAGDEHVVPPIADIVEQGAQIAAQLAYWDGLSHGISVQGGVRTGAAPSLKGDSPGGR
jgi:hypothetical protein